MGTFTGVKTTRLCRHHRVVVSRICEFVFLIFLTVAPVLCNPVCNLIVQYEIIAGNAQNLKLIDMVADNIVMRALHQFSAAVIAE